MIPKKNLPPQLALPILVALTSLFFQFLIIDYLLRLTNTQYHQELRHLQIEVTQDLAGQLSRAQASNDDLTSLASLRSARANHPQIVDAMIFDNAGKILLHTDPGWMGKKVNAPQGPRLALPVIKHFEEHGRSLLSIQVPLPDRDDGYFRANFDEAKFVQESQSISLRFYVLILLTSAVLGFLTWARLRRYELVDPQQRAGHDASSTALVSALRLEHTAELLLGEMPHATLAVDRENRVMGANALALELLNCRREELVGSHIFSASLPPALVDFYQSSLKKAGQLCEAKLSLNPKSSPLQARALFSPASDQWELALVTLQ
jgi:PAS domain-containing protein